MLKTFKVTLYSSSQVITFVNEWKLPKSCRNTGASISGFTIHSFGVERDIINTVPGELENQIHSLFGTVLQAHGLYHTECDNVTGFSILGESRASQDKSSS